MSNENPAPEPSDSKRRLRDRFTRRPADNDKSVNTTSVKEKVKTGLAVVGAVTVVGVAAAVATKKKGVKVEATLPDVDVVPTDG